MSDTTPTLPTLPTVNVAACHASEAYKATKENHKEWNKGAPCALCNRGLKASGGRRWVLFVDGATDTAANKADEAAWQNVPGFMGFHPVGPGCARKLRRAGVPDAWMMTDADW